jgi:hypothetical protein
LGKKEMRGANLKNRYVIEGIEHTYEELTPSLKVSIEKHLDRKVYNDFRNELFAAEGDDLNGTIKIEFPTLKMTAFDEYGVKL